MPTDRLRLPDRPDLRGQTVVVTGANSGIGKETAVALAAMGASVVMTARDPGRGAAAHAEVVSRSGSEDVELAALDLASVASITAFADHLLATRPRLDVLVNNAGIILDERTETADGFELMIGVNHVGHHLLTRLLTERLVASAPARVITVASVAHRRVTRQLDAGALAARDDFHAFRQYARSKLANILFTRELDRRLRSRGVRAVSAHPGVVRSGFGAEGDHAVIGPLVDAFGRVVMISPERGARTQVALAAADDISALGGAYVVRGRVHRPSRLARDPEAAAWLWDETEAMLARVGAGA